MKKFIVFAMACMLVFSLFIMPASAAGDLEIDIDSLTQGNDPCFLGSWIY